MDRTTQFVWVNFLIAGMYVVTRTVGIPFFGPEAGEIAAWGASRLITTPLELLLVALLLVMLRHRRFMQREGALR